MSRRVLIIDDDPIAREVSASVLRDGGFHVVELPSPIGASRVLLSEPIDLVILDMFMPQMDGDRFMRLLRDNRKLAAIPVILVSGAEPGELHDIGRRTQPTAIVPKFAVRARLLETAERCVERPAARAAKNP